MSKLLPKLWAKTVFLLLLTASVLLCTLSALGIAFLVDQNVYLDKGSLARRSIVSGRLFDVRMNQLDQYCQAYARGEAWELPYYEGLFAPEASNFFFTVRDEDGGVWLQNYHEDEWQYSESRTIQTLRDTRRQSYSLSFDTVEDRWQYLDECMTRYWDVNYNVWDSDTDGDGEYECGLDITYIEGTPVYLTAVGYVRASLRAPDDFNSVGFLLDLAVRYRYGLIALCAVSLLAGIFSFVFLLCAAGRREGAPGPGLGWQDRIPLDVYAAALGLLLAVNVSCVDAYSGWEAILLLGVSALVWIPLGMSLVMTFAARAKVGGWWRNTVILRTLVLLWRCLCAMGRLCAAGVRTLPLYWKTGLLWCGLSLLELICMAFAQAEGGLVLLWLLEKLLLTPLLLIAVVNLRRLQKGGEALAAGDMAYAVPLQRMLPDFRRHGEQLNSIREGMRRAVEEQMKSERLKTELITNVSHDLKTPLTSIVSYVDLLGRPETGEAEAKEYLAVLQRQSARLKKLTEDLLEASKASSGSMAVNFERVDVNLLLGQAAGEYESRFDARRLTPVLTNAPDAPFVRADGKLLWRVFDNLLGNVCKYAQEGTRVYLSVETAGERVRVVMKNTSAEPLNISADELMERFVRGDSARSTEGSGLGLSIARSLTELQNGAFHLSIDGDLFKAIVEFPAA